jgi:hypothetical protein
MQANRLSSVHEPRITLGAARHGLVDAATEKPVDDSAFTRSVDDHVCRSLVGDREQPVNRVAGFWDVICVDSPRRELAPRSLEQPVLGRVRRGPSGDRCRRRDDLGSRGSTASPPGSMATSRAAGPTVTTTTLAPKASARSVARASARLASSLPSNPTTIVFTGCVYPCDSTRCMERAQQGPQGAARRYALRGGSRRPAMDPAAARASEVPTG